MRTLNLFSIGCLAVGLVVVGSWNSLRGEESSNPEQPIAELKQHIDGLQARIKALEQRIEKLEAAKPSSVQVLQAPKLPPSTTAPPMITAPRPDQLPNGWQEREFNGMKYYLIPLRQF
jgi:hypothetical protein